MAKKYTQKELENLSIQELMRIDKEPPTPLPTQDCLEEKQLLEGIRQLTSPQDILEILNTYLLYNEPCIKIPVKSRLKSNTK